MPLKNSSYSKEDVEQIIDEIQILFNIRGERLVNETIANWLSACQRMGNMTLRQLIMKIRVACTKKRYGAFTTLGDILDNDDYLSEYQKYYQSNETVDKNLFGKTE